MRQYAGFASRARSRTRATAICSSAGRRASRSRSTCRRSSATTRTTRARSARSAGRCRDRLDRGHGDPARGHPARPRSSTSMTINAPASLLLLLYELVAEEQGVASADAARDGAERHPQGVRRARDLHLPAEAVDAARRPICSRTARSGSRAGTRSRSPGTTSARRGRRRSQELAFTLANGDRLRRSGAVDAGLAPDDFGAAALVLLQRAQRLLRGGREVPRRAPPVGADHARALRRDESASAQALRFHAQTGGSTLTAQQPENNIVRVAIAGAGGGRWRRAVAAHERIRRGARAADRALGAHRAAHAAGHRLRERASRHASTRSAARTTSRRSPPSWRRARGS